MGQSLHVNQGIIHNVLKPSKGHRNWNVWAKVLSVLENPWKF